MEGLNIESFHEYMSEYRKRTQKGKCSNNRIKLIYGYVRTVWKM